MSLFQNAVLNKYLNGLETQRVNAAYEKFTAHFHNPSIQENIRNSKEEQYQGEFLIDLFVKVLGYIKNPTPDFNLTTELKNAKGAKKADGAILSGKKALAVIELKGTDTTDLSKVEVQAFGYKNNQPGSHYVITSNFEKLRFYIDNAVDFEEFNLFNLSKERFHILWLCLSAENLLANIPKKLKDESLTQEENITKKLYKDYAAFRNEIFDSLQKENPAYDKLTLFKKTQKLLDRFLFIFFAEDRLLLPPNSIRSIVNQWTELKEKYDEYFPLYDRFKKYFGYMNTGHKGQQHDIFAYNGGLFAPDDVLDNIKINDDLLHKHTLNLSKYDFESEVSVNILGHIFEHSLNDIDEIQAEIQGVAPEQGKTKRKKDGVFYTPKYITKYIVDHTVGKLCDQKKNELGLQEADYEKERKGRQKETVKKLNQKLDSYRNWLLQLTICDPACGSGAFLNQALEFLIAEHKYVDELQAKLFGDAMVLSEVENAILEHNLFGVDINQESVEIAKLSLWLRTAQKGRKLTSLNNNIKCGNSLISDPDVAGDKAFNWQKAFPTVFQRKEKEAFHVVLTTHNSRTSQRMLTYNVKKGPPIELNLEQEIALAKIMKAVILENDYKVIAFNICKDHVHIILVCAHSELTGIIQKLKSISSKLYNSMGHDPLGDEPDPLGVDNDPLGDVEERKYTPFWSQKFFRANLDVWALAEQTNTTGHRYKATYLDNAIPYIQNNRIKHELPASKALEDIIAEFTVSQEVAFAEEYAGGFDVVIGNPPYLRIQGLQEFYPEMVKYYDKHFESATGNYDIYVLFMEQSHSLINPNGLISFILPHKFLISEFGQGIRTFLSSRKTVDAILHFEEHLVFEVTTYTCIINMSHQKNTAIKFKYILPENIVNPFEWDTMETQYLDAGNWNLMRTEKKNLFIKLEKMPYTIKDIFSKVFVGLQTSADKIYLIDGKEKNGFVEGYSAALNKTVRIENGLMKPLLKGQDVSKYQRLENIYYVIFPYLISDDGNASEMTEQYIRETFPLGYAYLKENEDELRGRERGRFNNDKEWFLFSRKQGITEVEQPKIITPEISLGTNMTLDEGVMYHSTTVYSFILKEPSIDRYKYYLTILNSKMVWFHLKNTGTVLRGGYFRFKTKYLFPFPLPEEASNKADFIENADKMLALHRDLQAIIEPFKRAMQRRFPEQLEKLSKKLEAWHTLSYAGFVKELTKKKISLSLSQEAEWESYFETEKLKASTLKAQIAETDRQIDQMVYDLYGLTPEEIAIVEEASA